MLRARRCARATRLRDTARSSRGRRAGCDRAAPPACARAKPTTASTLRSASSSVARSANGTIGRRSPLSARTESSPLRPTISASPCARAHARYSTWPGVQHVEAAVGKDDAFAVGAQRFAPRDRFARRRACAPKNASCHRPCSTSARISSALAVAVPSFSTTAPAAKFASCIAAFDRRRRRRAPARARR